MPKPTAAKPATSASKTLTLAEAGARVLKNIPVSKLVWDHDRDIGEKDEGPRGFPALLKSIKDEGIEQSVSVEPIDNSDMFHVLAGKRRSEAAKRLSPDGSFLVPCLVLTGKNAQAVALRENNDRRDLSNYEFVSQVVGLKNSGMKVKDICEDVGITESYVHSFNRIVKNLSAESMAAFKADRITIPQAMTLSAKNHEEQVALLATMLLANGEAAPAVEGDDGTTVATTTDGEGESSKTTPEERAAKKAATNAFIADLAARFPNVDGALLVRIAKLIPAVAKDGTSPRDDLFALLASAEMGPEERKRYAVKPATAPSPVAQAAAVAVAHDAAVVPSVDDFTGAEQTLDQETAHQHNLGGGRHSSTKVDGSVTMK